MISEKFIEECKNRANANRLGKITVDGIENPITNSDNLQSFSIDSGCYVNGNIIGSVYAKCLEASFITDIADLSGKTTYAQIGVKYDDSTTEYIKMGKYTVERPNNEITANMSQITAYDDLYTNLDNQYVCGIDYSKGNVTVKDLYIDVCKQLGLTPKTTSFLNDNISIENNPFTNKEKNRTILQTIGKISCSFIDIDVETNEIDLCWVSQSEEPDYIFYKNDYASVEGGQVVCGPINCLIIKNSQIDSENVTIKDDEDIALNGEHSITISEDYILHNEELRQQAITNIWNRVHGMKYVDCKLTTYYGKPFMKLGTRIRIYIDDDNTQYIDTYVLKHNFTYDGSFNSIIESPALTQQEIKVKQDISLGEALKNTQIDVDKQNQKIESVVSDVNNQNEKISKVTQTVDEIKQQISSITDFTIDNSTQNGHLIIDNVGNGFILNLVIHPTGHSPLAKTYPNNLIYPRDDTFTIVDNIILEIKNETTKETINYTIPTDLYYLDNDTYDILEYSYGSDKCKITKNIGFSNGSPYKLDNPIIEEHDFPIIDTEEGVYHFNLVGFNNGYIYVKLLGKNDFTDIFALKKELRTAITQTDEKITLEANRITKNIQDNYSTTEQMNSAINLSADSVKQSVSSQITDLDGKVQKVEGNMDLYIKKKDTGEVISAFNLNSNEVVINSDNFKLDKNGNMTCSKANITGGKVAISTTSMDDYISVKNKTSGVETKITSSTFAGINENGETQTLILSTIGSIRCVSLTQTSLMSQKKNFKKFTGALKIIDDIDLYKYNLKREKDTAKKHIGFVIGAGFKYSSEITSLDEEGNESGVDIYSMTSLCLQAIKEQKAIIEELKKEIDLLKGVDEK